MSKCGKCGVETKENARYCKSCGSSLSFSDKKARVMTQEKRWVKPAAIAAVVPIATKSAARNAIASSRADRRLPSSSVVRRVSSRVSGPPVSESLAIAVPG